MLHTWNQELDVHPHVHALVPGSFPSLDGQQWITSKHPKHRRRSKPYLCDNFKLSEKFRQKFVAGLERLYQQGKLKFEHETAAEPAAFEAWVKQLEALAWDVYIQGPPSDDSEPLHAAKNLARYMTGGPISDARLISYDGQQVHFWARSSDKKNQSRPFRLGAREFGVGRSIFSPRALPRAAVTVDFIIPSEPTTWLCAASCNRPLPSNSHTRRLPK